jgi:hypothetical protein
VRWLFHFAEFSVSKGPFIRERVSDVQALLLTRIGRRAVIYHDSKQLTGVSKRSL